MLTQYPMRIPVRVRTVFLPNSISSLLLPVSTAGHNWTTFSNLKKYSCRCAYIPSIILSTEISDPLRCQFVCLLLSLYAKMAWNQVEATFVSKYTVQRARGNSDAFWLRLDCLYIYEQCNESRYPVFNRL